MSVLILGRRRQGKTTLAMHLALRVPGRAVAAFDPRRQLKRWPVAVDPDSFRQLVESGEHFVVVYQPSINVREEFSVFCETLWGRRHYAMLIDEASQVQSPQQLHPWLDRFIRMSDPEQVEIIQTFHRPSDSNLLCRSLACDLFLFRTTLARDLDIIEGQCGPEVRSRLSSLPDHTPIRWNEDKESFEIWDEPYLWHIPLKEEQCLNRYGNHGPNPRSRRTPQLTTERMKTNGLAA